MSARMSLPPDVLIDALADVSHGRIVLLNSQTERLFGYDRRDLLGQPVEVLVPERFCRIHPGHRGGRFASAAAVGDVSE